MLCVFRVIISMKEFVIILPLHRNAISVLKRVQCVFSLLREVQFYDLSAHGRGTCLNNFSRRV